MPNVTEVPSRKDQAGLMLELCEELENRLCDLRCRDVPTAGGDDADVEWIVVEHYMAAPKERIIGIDRTLIGALMNAFCTN